MFITSLSMLVPPSSGGQVQRWRSHSLTVLRIPGDDRESPLSSHSPRYPFTLTHSHTCSTIYVRLRACTPSAPSKLLSQREMWDMLCMWVPPADTSYPHFIPEGSRQRGRGWEEDARGRSHKTLTLKASPCLWRPASQQGLSDPVTGHCRGQHAPSCAHCHSCQSANYYDPHKWWYLCTLQCLSTDWWSLFN